MLLKVFSRVAAFVGSLLVGSILIFLMMNILPGNPAQVAAGVNATPQSVQALEVKFGLDRPLFVQYFDWAGHLFRGDFGTSYVSNYNITSEVINKFQNTLYLLIGGVVVALVIAIPLGVLMAARNGKASGLGLSVISQIGISIPAFALAIILTTYLSVRNDYFATGFTNPSEDFALFLNQMVLPWISLGVVQGAVLSRYVRSSILDVMRQDYIRTARAKGLTPYRAIVKHGLRNAAVPVVTVLGLQLTTLLIGAVVIERAFTIPGLGSMLVSKVANRDLISVQSIVMLLVAVTLLIMLIVEILYLIINPRLRSSR